MLAFMLVDIDSQYLAFIINANIISSDRMSDNDSFHLIKRKCLVNFFFSRFRLNKISAVSKQRRTRPIKKFTDYTVSH